jgi:RNA polymerase sigma factor (sigma-70 family)
VEEQAYSGLADWVSIALFFSCLCGFKWFAFLTGASLMRPRHTLLELFSTFLQFEADRFSGWATDSRLRRSMTACLAKPAGLAKQSDSEDSEKFWATYWYKLWRASSADRAAAIQAHLSAYLQEVCYWATRKTLTTFTVTQYTFSDCFQVAIARVDKVLRGFDPTYGVDLKAYAGISFGRLIQDFLKQQRVIDICSDSGLLRKLSQKRLATALENAMFSPQVIAAYLLAWRCFKEIYVPDQAHATAKLAKPNDATWRAIAQLYNQERLTQLQPPGAEWTPATLEKWMADCVRAVRAYLYPGSISINAPRAGQETGELLDSLAEDNPDLLTRLIETEEDQVRQQQKAQINQVFTAALATLDPQIQQLLELYYAQNLTQQEMAKRLDIKQYTISRRFSKARGMLLLALAEWSQTTLHIVPDSDVLTHISPVLDEWLVTHYQSSAFPPS